MNELEIQLLSVSPAIIEFNHMEIMNKLDDTLKRYKGVIHTEETSAILRKDIAELRRAKKSLNRVRIDEKNKMMIPIKEFEDKIKQIEAKIEEVELPLSEQEGEFEIKRREAKEIVVKEIRLKVMEDVGLVDMSEEVITIMSSYLTKTKTLTKIEEEMAQQAYDIKQSVEARKANEQIITLTVESLNASNNLNLTVSPYLSQLEIYDVEQVKHTIESDVQKELIKAEEKAKREKEKEEAALKKEEREAELKQAEEDAKREKDAVDQKEIAELSADLSGSEGSEEEERTNMVNDVAFDSMDFDQFEDEDNESYRVISFKADSEKYNQVIEALESLEIEWSAY